MADVLNVFPSKILGCKSSLDPTFNQPFLYFMLSLWQVVNGYGFLTPWLKDQWCTRPSLLVHLMMSIVSYSLFPIQITIIVSYIHSLHCMHFHSKNVHFPSISSFAIKTDYIKHSVIAFWNDMNTIIQWTKFYLLNSLILLFIWDCSYASNIFAIIIYAYILCIAQLLFIFTYSFAPDQWLNALWMSLCISALSILAWCLYTVASNSLYSWKTWNADTWNFGRKWVCHPSFTSAITSFLALPWNLLWRLVHETYIYNIWDWSIYTLWIFPRQCQLQLHYPEFECIECS